MALDPTKHADWEVAQEAESRMKTCYQLADPGAGLLTRRCWQGGKHTIYLLGDGLARRPSGSPPNRVTQGRLRVNLPRADVAAQPAAASQRGRPDRCFRARLGV